MKNTVFTAPTSTKIMTCLQNHIVVSPIKTDSHFDEIEAIKAVLCLPSRCTVPYRSMKSPAYGDGLNETKHCLRWYIFLLTVNILRYHFKEESRGEIHAKRIESA